MHAKFTKIGLYEILFISKSEALRNFMCCLEKNISLSTYVIWHINYINID